MLAGFTIYGNKVGNFVIQVDLNDNVRLSLSQKEDLSDASSRIVTSGINDQMDATYDFIPNDIAAGIGLKNDTKNRRYVAFSFYLLNNSSRAIDYRASIDIIDMVGDPLSVLRVMVIVDDQDKSAGTIYAVPETEEGAAIMNANFENEGFTKYTTQDIVAVDGEFKEVMHIDVKDFAKGGQTKYTIVMWLEGNDPQCTNDRFGDRIKMEMNFRGF